MESWHLLFSFVSFGFVSLAMFGIHVSAIAKERDEQRLTFESAMRYIAGKNALEAEKALAFKQHEEEALRQAKESFEVSLAKGSSSQTSSIPLEPGTILKDSHGNEYDILS